MKKKQNIKLAEEKLREYISFDGLSLYPAPKYLQLLPLYNIFKMEKKDVKIMKNINNSVKKDIMSGSLTAEVVDIRIRYLLTQEYGEPMNQDEVIVNKKELESNPLYKKEKELESKFGITFHNKYWFRCTIEEIRATTFSNNPTRDVDTAYVFVEDSYIEIFKESVWLKTDVGSRKVYFENLASIDYDKPGKFHISSSLFLNTKSAEHVQLKFIKEENAKYILDKFDNYLNSKNIPKETPSVISNADELLKYADLYERGFLTREEFESKKKELL